jgi:hypothetical protein
VNDNFYRRVRLAWLQSLGGTRPTYLVAIVAFVYGYVTTGAIENDHFVMLARAFQVLYGDWPVRDFVDPGQPLAYLISTGGAALFGPTLLVNVVVCLLFFAATAAFTYVLALRATASVVAALVAAALAIVFYPRLYNTTKVIVPLVAIALAWRYVDRPDITRLVALAGWTVVAFLMRHDYAVYVGLATAVMLGVAHADAPALGARRIAMYAAWSLLFASPWLVYVQSQQGLVDYFASAVRFSVAEQRRTVGGLPTTPLFYLFVAVPIAGLAMSFRRGPRLTAAHLVAASVLVLLLDVAFLRDVLRARIADVVPPMTVVVACMAGHIWSPRMVSRIAIGVLVIAVAAALIPVAARARTVSTPLAMVRHVNDVTRRLRTASPEIQPNPALAPIVNYLARCTAPADRVLVGGFGPEIPVLAHRPFASGLASWIPGYYEEKPDVDRALAQLNRERVGTAVMLDGSRVFFTLWPTLGAWLTTHGFEEYPVTRINARIQIWLPRRANGAPIDAATDLPCR